ncbi:magnesium-translocating P-type ATPase [Intestinibacter sp.]
MKTEDQIQTRIYEYAKKDISRLYKDFNITDKGYSEQQVHFSRERYGINIGDRKKDTDLYRFFRAFINPFSVILLMLIFVSFFTDVLLASNYRRNATTCLMLVIIFLISGFVRFIQEMRSKKATDSLIELIHTTVQVYRDGLWKDISSDKLVVGDKVRFYAGDRIPADIRLSATNDFFVSQSMLTGESLVIEKNSDIMLEKENLNLNDYNNIVFSGSLVIGGNGEGIVLAVGKETVYGEIGKNINVQKNGFDKGANSIAGVLIRFMVVLIPFVFIACGLVQGNWMSAFLFSLSVAVGLTPEMLPMVINACLVKGSAVMGKKDAIVKNINAMQAFGSMNVLCVDKTGTLTGDKIVLEYYTDILGNESKQVLEYAYLNSLYHTGVKNHLDDAVCRVEQMPNFDKCELLDKYKKLDELPFDYNRKYVSVLFENKDKNINNKNENILIIKGDVETVCKKCKYAEYRGSLQLMDMQSVHHIIDEMQEDGMKVIAVAYKNIAKAHVTLDDEKNLILLGYLAFFDAPKKSAGEAIEKLKKLNVPIKVLTGDSQSVATSICRRLNLDIENAIDGKQLEQLTDDELLIQVEKTTLFTELSPKQKSKIIEVLQGNGHTVGFLGDGMNDLHAILQSDVGISVEGATEALKEAADVILLKKDLNVLEEAILEGRKVFVNMCKYIRITASSNFGNILAVVIASVLLPFFPMTSIQLLLLNLLYDVLCLVLPWDTVDEELYCHPRDWSGKTLGRFMLFFGPISTVFDLLTFAFLFLWLCPKICGGSFASLDPQAQKMFITFFQTGWFLESMWSQVLILYSLRSKEIPFIKSRPAKPVVLVTIVGIIMFTIMTIVPIGNLVGLTVMPLSYFVFLLIAVLLYISLVTIAKAWYIKKYRELI